MNSLPPPPILLWIIESKSGAWATNKPEVAAKHENKPGSIVTPYYSKVAACATK